MSLTELNRLREAIKSNPALVGEIKQKMQAGGADGAASYVRSLGYDVSPSDVSELVASGAELSEHELELVSGGIVHGSTMRTTITVTPPAGGGGSVVSGGPVYVTPGASTPAAAPTQASNSANAGQHKKTS